MVEGYFQNTSINITFSMTSIKTVMIVDDEPINILLLNEILGKKDYNIIAAYSGDESLLKMKDILPDVVFLDLMMPGINGFEVLERMKSDPNLKSIPVIMVTALNEHLIKERAKSMGAIEFLLKPVNADKIFTTLEKIER
jgi:CheY-like chemotaxis protein